MREVNFYKTDSGDCPMKDLAQLLNKKIKNMSDLQQYITKRKAQDKLFNDGFDEGYQSFKIGVLLQQAREACGLTQEEVAERLHTKKSAIVRIENHTLKK